MAGRCDIEASVRYAESAAAARICLDSYYSAETYVEFIFARSIFSNIAFAAG